MVTVFKDNISTDTRAYKLGSRTTPRAGTVASKIRLFQELEASTQKAPQLQPGPPRRIVQDKTMTEGEVLLSAEPHGQSYGTAKHDIQKLSDAIRRLSSQQDVRERSDLAIHIPSRIPVNTKRFSNATTSLAAYGRRKTLRFQAPAGRRTSKAHEHRKPPGFWDNFPPHSAFHGLMGMRDTSPPDHTSPNRPNDAADECKRKSPSVSDQPSEAKTSFELVAEKAGLLARQGMSVGKIIGLSIVKSSNPSEEKIVLTEQEAFAVQQGIVLDPIGKYMPLYKMFTVGPADSIASDMISPKSSVPLWTDDGSLPKRFSSSPVESAPNSEIRAATDMLDRIIVEHGRSLQEIAVKLSDELSGLSKEIESAQINLLPEQYPQPHRSIFYQAAELQTQSHSFAGLIKLVEMAAAAWKLDREGLYSEYDCTSQVERASIYSPPSIEMPIPLRPASSMLLSLPPVPKEGQYTHLRPDASSVGSIITSIRSLPAVSAPQHHESCDSESTFKSDPIITGSPWNLTALSPLMIERFPRFHTTLRKLLLPKNEANSPRPKKVVLQKRPNQLETLKQRRLRRRSTDHKVRGQEYGTFALRVKGIGIA